MGRYDKMLVVHIFGGSVIAKSPSGKHLEVDNSPLGYIRLVKAIDFSKELTLNIGDRVELTRDIKHYKKGEKFRVIKDLGKIVEVIHEKDFKIMKAGKRSRDFRKIEKE